MEIYIFFYLHQCKSLCCVLGPVCLLCYPHILQNPYAHTFDRNHTCLIAWCHTVTHSSNIAHQDAPWQAQTCIVATSCMVMMMPGVPQHPEIELRCVCRHLCGSGDWLANGAAVRSNHQGVLHAKHAHLKGLPAAAHGPSWSHRARHLLHTLL